MSHPPSHVAGRRRTLATTLAVAIVGACAAAVLIGCNGAGSGDTATPETGGAASAPAFDLPADFEQAEASITAEDLRTAVAALAADEMRGRGPGSEGDQRARTYLAERMEQLGLEPAGENGGWEQPFDIVGIEAAMPATWTFTTGTPSGQGQTLSLARSDEFIASSGTQSETASLSDAELVFVGYGIQAPEFGWDDYQGSDLRGKVLLMLNNDPDWSDDLFAGTTRLYYGRWTYKYESAARQGAAGAIIVHTTPSAGYGWNVVQTSWTGEQFQLPAGDEPRLEVEAWITEEAAKRLLAAAGKSLDELAEGAKTGELSPVPLGITTSLTLRNKISRTQTANVLGRLPGTDPELSDEYVVWSAHHDHLGDAGDVGDAADAANAAATGDEDTIFNGALDNASGCAQLLEIAEALALTPTRRSHLFAFVAAEEQGLLGSEYYATHPTIAPGRIAANINYDGANIWGRARDVAFIGLGKSSLDAVVGAGASRQGRTVVPDQFPDRGFFYRSDQFNFAKIGVPAIYLDTGSDFDGRPAGWGADQVEAWEAEHYHQVSDELDDSWSFEGIIDDTRLGLYCGVVVANREGLPSWNPGDEFAGAREAALSAVADD